MIDVIHKLGGWIRGMTSAASTSRPVRSQGLVVERLEPRQLLAGDCLFVMDVASPQVEDGPIFGDFSSEPLEFAQNEGGWRSAPSMREVSGVPELLVECEDYHEIYLDNLVDNIGELFEVEDVLFGDGDAFEGEEDWGMPWFA